MNDCKLIAITPDAEKLIGYCARVSNPTNQGNPDVAGLLRYCIREKHWSIFEMANMVLEVNTTRAISHQIVRHRSFQFQQHSQRYSDLVEFVPSEARRQDATNRQNSIDDLPSDIKEWFHELLDRHTCMSRSLYLEALNRGIAKECARAFLPECTATRLYMNGTIRSWIHYIDLRIGNGTQKEHTDIARSARRIFCRELPAIAEALGWLVRRERKVPTGWAPMIEYEIVGDSWCEGGEQ